MTDTFKVAIGPQHPALKEPSHFDLTVEGETVVQASVRLGYAHRGIEKPPRPTTGTRTSICWSASAGFAPTPTP
ncbi:MAG: hypothetical protein HC915_16745 [Anaerolineae bacterium]|nr:hypothetical protein [Anaerolineae bacterium]